MRVPITLDLHVGNFTYPDTTEPDEIFEKLVAMATTCEASGFSSMSLMDHLHQIPGVGTPEKWMFEGSTMLAALAARTETLTFGLLVGSVTYRNPALAAKITTTVDIISKGRVWHGLGAGWFEAEHNAYGFDFPPLKTRFEMLEEALQISKLMFRGDAGTSGSFAGQHFRIDEPYNNPKPIRGDIPILIGGSGEKKTLRLVAQYGDGCNFFGDVDQCTHLLGVLREHCDRQGRDFDEITKTAMARVIVTDTEAQAQQWRERLLEMGTPQALVDSALIGPESVVIEKAEALRAVGIEGLTVVGPLAHDLEQLKRVGGVLGPVFGDAANL
ncbi:LLM class F420-dependent oxidoreductase [Jongsikchunia kroppenstedtii]|uniref:LLM class F420-dependent oxidoreductase n=1 Tax=Jongsikchunia kroppenstedtii TaxID=1121721 RepID=UPI000380527C|nr:LLM class F420-dependent oxidoreductase [Jongsikchunia kroppenstedtii]